ncbi:MAG TPA: hypothetical protein VEF04_11330 [Blastocatellia bacterium]|nr:hypothetical protein [Blastocatellia bacterium]
MAGSLQGGGRVPGALGATIVGGMNIGPHLNNINLGLLAWKGAAKKAVKEVGKKLASLGFKNAGKRLAGKLFIGSGAWNKAFKHVALHFSEAAFAKKASHSVFHSAFRSKAALETLLKDAVTKPSRKILTRATIDGVPAGRPVVVLEREFGQEIGEMLGRQMENGAEKIVRTPCKILRVVVDITGRPVTAFPVPTFL